MLPIQRPAIAASLALCVLLGVTGCANSPTGNNLEQSFASDPRLQESPGNSSSSPNGTATNRPAGFPDEIPIYPNAQLQEAPSETSVTAYPSPASPTATVSPSPTVTPEAQGGQARWRSSDPDNLVRDFYQTEFQESGWQLVSQTTDSQTIVARRNDLQATVTIQPIAVVTATPASPTNSPAPLGDRTPQTSPTASPSSASPGNEAKTEFIIQYTYEPGTDSAQSPNGATTPSNNSSSAQLATNPVVFSDLDKAPKELQQYIRDLAQLGVLPLRATNAKGASAASSTQFEPNKTMTRREYARWLVAANNRIYTNRPGQQLRLSATSSKPVFQDVPTSDPDFAVIQGLAEAGIIPSPLSGDSTNTTFRPDAPLTRETLLLWKVPLDTRQALPSATIDAVKQTWGFQDASKIEPRALRAVLADFQNSDLANIRRAFGYTTLFQPKKPVTRAEAAATLWYFGAEGDGLSALEVLQTQRVSDASPSPVGP